MTKTDIIEKLSSLRDEGMTKLHYAKRQGQKVVGYYCTFAPQELAIAANAFAVPLCGTRPQPIAAAEKFLPRNLCPLIKSSFGYAVTDSCPFFHYADVLLAETTCDGKKKMFELLADIKPLHVMQLPQEQNSDDSKFLWRQSVARAAEFIEESFAITISDDSLRRAIKITNAERSASLSLMSLSRLNPSPITGLEMMTILYNRSFFPDKEYANSLLDELVQVIKDEYLPGINDNIRILLTGVPIGIGSEKIVRIIEELGGIVACQENCSGQKSLLPLISEDINDDPLEAIADKYLKISCSCMSPNQSRLNLLENLAVDYSVDAIIELGFVGCHTYNIEAYNVKKFVKQTLQLPYLFVETDYSEADDNQLTLRVEAFLSMVKYKKQGYNKIAQSSK